RIAGPSRVPGAAHPWAVRDGGSHHRLSASWDAEYPSVAAHKLGTLKPMQGGIGGIGIKNPALGILDGDADGQGIHDASKIGIGQRSGRRSRRPDALQHEREALTQGL